MLRRMRISAARTATASALLLTCLACQSDPGGREILISSEAEPEAAKAAGQAPTGPGPVAMMQDLIARKRIDTSAPGWKTKLPRPPTIRFPKDRTLFWMIETNFGLLKIKLLPRNAPRHVSTTMYLSQLGFYDNLTFHRIIPQFMAQGGDPLGNGKGGPGFTYNGEFNKKRPRLHDKRGVVSAANSGPHTDGSQFFILFAKNAEQLDGKHTIFGHLEEGQGTLGAMESAGSASGKPQTKVWIERTWIVEELD
jgi:peptidyl-prolyl cis-trans isomerase B (cyclophilin B)